MAWDLIVKNASVFDGSGTAGRDLDIAISAGKIAALGENLPEEAATFVDDVRGVVADDLLGEVRHAVQRRARGEPARRALRRGG